MNSTMRARPVRREDLDTLATLDARTCSRHGMPVLSQSDLECWYDEQSPLFLVAEDERGIHGYYFGRQIEFSMDAPEAFLTPCADGYEWERHPHVPGAESCYGICVVSETPGAGACLNIAVQDTLEALRARYFVGISRLSWLDRYLRPVEEREGPLSDPVGDLALWYAHESAELLGMPVWPACPPKPRLLMPELRRPDPVLAFHVRGTSFGLLGLLPDYMPDSASRNFGAVIVSAYPHRRPT